MGGRVVEGTGLEKRTPLFFYCFATPYCLRASLVFSAFADTTAETLHLRGGQFGGQAGLTSTSATLSASYEYSYRRTRAVPR
jgi:hypothetical protein